MSGRIWGPPALVSAPMSDPACCCCALQTAPEITSAAVAEADAVACEAVDIFLSIVGAEAGAMALRCLAKGRWRGREPSCALPTGS